MCILSNGAILSIANIHLAFGCPTANSLRLVLLSLPPLTVKFPTTLALPNPQGRRRASRRPARRPTVRSTPPVRTPASDPTKTASERPAGRRRRPGGYIAPRPKSPPKTALSVNMVDPLVHHWPSGPAGRLTPQHSGPAGPPAKGGIPAPALPVRRPTVPLAEASRLDPRPVRASPSGPVLPNTGPGSQGLSGNAYVLREPVSDRFPQYAVGEE